MPGELPQDKKPTFFGSHAVDQAVAGFTAGAVSTVVLHPLDLVKTRLQADTKRRAAFTPLTAVRALRDISASYGVRGLYMGVSPNFVGATASWGMYFFWYDWIKQRMLRSSQEEAAADGGDSQQVRLSHTQHLIAATEAGALTAVVTNPIWLVKTRMCLQSPDRPQYRSMADALVRIAREEGVAGLYRGFSMQIFGVAHGGIQFMVYEDMKRRSASFHQRHGQDRSWTLLFGTNTEVMLMGLASKVVAMFSTYPFQLIKTRLQALPTADGTAGSRSVRETVVQALRNEGVSGLYKGMGTATFRVLPGTAITFVVYDAEQLIAGATAVVCNPGSRRYEDWLDDTFISTVHHADKKTLIELTSTVVALACQLYGTQRDRVQEVPLRMLDAILDNKPAAVQRDVARAVAARVRQEVLGAAQAKVLPVAYTLAKSTVLYALRVVLRVSRQLGGDEQAHAATVQELLALQCQLVYIYLHQHAEAAARAREQAVIKLLGQHLRPDSAVSTARMILGGQLGAAPETVLGSAAYLGVCVRVMSTNAKSAPELQALRQDILRWLVKEVVGSKTAVPTGILVTASPALRLCQRDEFQSQLLPVIEKGLLRSPEVLLPVCAHMMTQFSFDLVFDALMEPLLAQLRSANETLRTQALSVLSIVISQSAEHGSPDEALVGLVKRIAASIVKCGQPEQRSAHYRAAQSFVGAKPEVYQAVISQLSKYLATDSNDASAGRLYDVLLQQLATLLQQDADGAPAAAQLVMPQLVKAVGDDKRAPLRKAALVAFSRYIVRPQLLAKSALAAYIAPLTSALVTLVEKFQAAPLTATFSFAEASAAVYILLSAPATAGKDSEKRTKAIQVTTTSSNASKKPGFMTMDKVYTKLSALDDAEAYIYALGHLLAQSSTSDASSAASALVYLGVLGGHHQIRMAAAQQVTELSKTCPNAVLASIVPAINKVIDDLSTQGQPERRHVQTAFGKLYAGLIQSAPAAGPQHVQRLLVELLFPAHHLLSSLPGMWTQLVYRCQADAEQILHQDPVPKRVLELCFERGLDAGQQLHKQCVLSIVRTCCFVSPTVYLPLFNDVAVARFRACDEAEVSEEDLNIWAAPEGELFVDVLNQPKTVDGRRKMAKPDVTPKKPGAPKGKLTKEEQAQVATQLALESATRARLNDLKKQVICALDVTAAMCAGTHEELTGYLTTLMAATLRCAKKCERLLDQQPFWTYMTIAQCLDEQVQDFVYALVVATFRACNIAGVPPQWQAVNLDVLTANVLFKLRYATTDSSFDSNTFTFVFQLLQPVVYAVNKRVVQLMQRKPSPAEQVQLDNWLDQLSLSCDVLASHVALGSSNTVPRLDMLTLLKHLLQQRLKLRSVAKQALVDLAEAIADSATEEEESVLLGGLFDEHELLREACLDAVQYLPPSATALTERSVKVFVLKHDSNQRVAKMSQDIWTAQQLSLAADALHQLLDLTGHDVEAVRFDAARSFRSFVKMHPTSIGQLLQSLYALYEKLLQPGEPEVDEFGIIIRGKEPRDFFEARHGLALGLHHVVDAVPSDQVRGVLAFLIDSEALGDRSEDVRDEMMRAGTLLVASHGKKSIDVILPRLEKYLSSPAQNSATHDHIREAVVILLGAAAKYLAPTDKRLPGIIDKLVDTLRTPSQAVQQAVGNHLPDLVKGRKDLAKPLVDRLVQQCLKGEKYADRRGAAYGLAGVIKGRGLGALKEYGVMTSLTEAINSKKKDNRGCQGAMFAIETLALALGRLFEPYVIQVLPLLLLCFGDNSMDVRNATQDAARAVMGHISGQCVKLMLSSLLSGLEDDAWRTKKGSIELLSSMAYCAPKQLTASLPIIVPRLCEVLTDSHLQVQSAGKQALVTFGEVITNPEIKTLVPTLLQALSHPDKYTVTALNSIGDTVFEHYIDAPSLAILVPSLRRGFRERSSDTRRKAAQIVGNLSLLTEAQDLKSYLDVLLPSVKMTLADAVPETRATSARTLGILMATMTEDAFPTLIDDLMRALKADTTSVERSGAAQGLAEILVALGVQRMEIMLDDIVAGCSSPHAHVREGFLSLVVYLPLTFGDDFKPYLASIIQPVLRGLADETEPVREIAMRAGRITVTKFSTSAVDLLLPELQKGLFDEAWRIRLSSVQLIGDLLCNLAGFSPMSSSLGKDDQAEGVAAEQGANDDEDEGANITASTESGRKSLVKTLGEHKYQEVLSALYVVRWDVSVVVRQAASQTWKVLVSNTPRTLKEMLPILMDLIIKNLASEEPDQRSVAAQALGEIVRKLGDRVLMRVLPILQERFQSDDELVRQGVCVGLQEVMQAAGRNNVAEFTSQFVSGVRRALVDPSPKVRETAAHAFDALQSNIGTAAIDQILPSLLNDLNSESKSTVALEALREMMAVRSSMVFPVLIPTLLKAPISEFNARALSSLITVAGPALIKRIDEVVPPLVQSLMDGGGQVREDIKETLRVLVTSVSEDEEGVDALALELLDMLGDSDNEPSLLVGACTAIGMVASCATADLSAHTHDMLRLTLDLFAHDDVSVVQAAWHALDAVVKSIRKEELDQFVGPTRRQLARMASRSKTSGTIAGFCLPKGIGPVLPIFLQGLMYGAAEVKEQAAFAIGDVINSSTAEALKPFVTQITGPLIRIVGDRVTAPLRTAILSTLGGLLAKTTVLLKPFLPQLQRTFVKSLSDTTAGVRDQAVQALAVLLTQQTRLDPLLTELCNTYRSTEDDDIKTSLLQAVQAVVTKQGVELGKPAQDLALATLQDARNEDNDALSSLARTCLAAL
ncbi:translational activator of GCN4 [Sorochytrium milnesiophthora]